VGHIQRRYTKAALHKFQFSFSLIITYPCPLSSLLAPTLTLTNLTHYSQFALLFCENKSRSKQLQGERTLTKQTESGLCPSYRLAHLPLNNSHVYLLILVLYSYLRTSVLSAVHDGSSGNPSRWRQRLYRKSLTWVSSVTPDTSCGCTISFTTAVSFHA
jgi:hypothetical protein